MSPIPLIIMGGSDRLAGDLPSWVQDQSPITGAKGATIVLDGRRLVDVLIDRFRRATDLFAPIYIAGPAAGYAQIASEVEVIDTDGGFGRNIASAIEFARKRHPGSSLAMSTCDILPEPDELRSLIEDYLRELPCDFWFPIIAVDERELGASEWKPRYQLVPRSGQPVSVLPGHLVVFDPEAMRLRFLYRLLQVGYSTRNRSVLHRRTAFVRHLLLSVITQDLLHLVTLRVPNVTWDTWRYGYFAARRLRDGTLTQDELETVIRRMFVRRRHRKRHPNRRARLPILRGMSLARDIDTREEAEALGATTL
ncbi:MAG TPA: hypothetical protein VMT85_17000 [Thermoanaerobaculia bacterium]|nr:hypothetical protein [Thermoanaerobaculia bacterium]